MNAEEPISKNCFTLAIVLHGAAKTYALEPFTRPIFTQIFGNKKLRLQNLVDKKAE